MSLDALDMLLNVKIQIFPCQTERKKNIYGRHVSLINPVSYLYKYLQFNVIDGFIHSTVCPIFMTNGDSSFSLEVCLRFSSRVIFFGPSGALSEIPEVLIAMAI